MKNQNLQFSLITFVVFLSATLSACVDFNDDLPANRVEKVYVTVLPETEIIYPAMDWEGKCPLEAIVMVEDCGTRHIVTPASVDGFEWEPGFTYRLYLRKTILANPPMDSSNLTFALLKIIYKE